MGEPASAMPEPVWQPSVAQVVAALNEVWGRMDNPEDVDTDTARVCEWAHQVVDHHDGH